MLDDMLDRCWIIAVRNSTVRKILSIEMGREVTLDEGVSSTSWNRMMTHESKSVSVELMG